MPRKTDVPAAKTYQKFIKFCFCVLLVFGIHCLYFWFTRNDNNGGTVVLESSATSHQSIRVAFIGNSLLFYNDCPGLLAAMLEEAGHSVTYEACLRGGASFSTIHKPETGCSASFQISKGAEPLTVHSLLNQQKWDFVILHDQSRAPADKVTRMVHLMHLNHSFVDPIHQSGAIPIFMQTAGYRDPTTAFEWMTQQLHEGYDLYAHFTTEKLSTKKAANPPKAKVAPVGEAFAQIYHTNQELWKRLYIEDGVHPSALGTWLQACVLFSIITATKPPPYQSSLWKGTVLQAPTEEEAKALRSTAWSVVASAANP